MIAADIDLATLAVLIPGALLGCIALNVFYNLFLHPLRSYPGPLIARATIIPQHWKALNANHHYWIRDLHNKHGPVVRIAPNELSFIDPEAWKDAYGHRSGFAKDANFYGPDLYGHPYSIIRADDINHARQRKLISHAFSDKALKEQDPLLKKHISLLIERLKDFAEGKKEGQPELVSWYNFCTFDIMADLTFGDSLGQLTNSAYSPWVAAVFANIKFQTLMRICREWPGVTKLISYLIPTKLAEQRELHKKFAAERVDARMARKTDRPDIWGLVMKGSGGEQGLSRIESHNNGALFMAAGTETTATLLSGLTYLLLTNPDKLERVTKEVRDNFKSFEDLHVADLPRLPYLNACIEEGLRRYPPVGTGLRRVARSPGAKICGNFVPGGTLVTITQWVTYHSPINFTNPNKFAPERFLPEGAEEYGSDRKSALNPFSVGPRNCIGKNLAYHEMRMILASMLLHFDMELGDGNGDWLDQPLYIVWEKKPLYVKLKAAK